MKGMRVPVPMDISGWTCMTWTILKAAEIPGLVFILLWLVAKMAQDPKRNDGETFLE